MNKGIRIFMGLLCAAFVMMESRYLYQACRDAFLYSLYGKIFNRNFQSVVASTGMEDYTLTYYFERSDKRERLSQRAELTPFEGK